LQRILMNWIRIFEMSCFIWASREQARERSGREGSKTSFHTSLLSGTNPSIWQFSGRLVDWYCGYGGTTPCAPRP
jgi:hypothetical protein